MQKRSEQDIIAQTPITVRFGAKDYEVKPLTILKSRAWRTKLSELIAATAGSSTAEPEGNVSEWMKGEFMGSVTLQLARAPEKLADLIFEYAANLPKETILEEGTEEQMLVAFGQVFALAFPFFSVLGTLMEMSKTQTSSAAPKYTN